MTRLAHDKLPAEFAMSCLDEEAAAFLANLEKAANELHRGLDAACSNASIDAALREELTLLTERALYVKANFVALLSGIRWWASVQPEASDMPRSPTVN